eukprot:709432-Hanusia_phi.AAC.1
MLPESSTGAACCTLNLTGESRGVPPPGGSDRTVGTATVRPSEGLRPAGDRSARPRAAGIESHPIRPPGPVERRRAPGAGGPVTPGARRMIGSFGGIPGDVTVPLTLTVRGATVRYRTVTVHSAGTGPWQPARLAELAARKLRTATGHGPYISTQFSLPTTRTDRSDTAR